MTRYSIDPDGDFDFDFDFDFDSHSDSDIDSYSLNSPETLTEQRFRRICVSNKKKTPDRYGTGVFHLT